MDKSFVYFMSNRQMIQMVLIKQMVPSSKKEEEYI